MMDFSDMSVHSLVGGLMSAGSHGIDENAPEIALMESALRHKVIEEASVGVGEIGRHWVGEDEGGCFAQTVRTVNGDGEEEDIGEGNYDLIPRVEE